MLRSKLDEFLKNETITCDAFKGVISCLFNRLNQIFDDLCVPDECQITKAYKCVNEFAFWNKNKHRLPKWSILKKMWKQSDSDDADEDDDSKMSDQSADSSSEKDSSEEKSGDRYCWSVFIVFHNNRHRKGCNEPKHAIGAALP